MSQSEYLITGVTRRPLMQGLQETNMSESFHVFLSHNSQDKPIVRKLAQALKLYDLRVWLDGKRSLPPAFSWKRGHLGPHFSGRDARAPRGE